MGEDPLPPFDLPAIARNKVTVAFDSGRLSSNGGVLLLCGVERRNPKYIDYPVEEMLRLHMFAIAEGYEDAKDCAKLRDDPVLKMAVGHAGE